MDEVLDRLNIIITRIEGIEGAIGNLATRIDSLEKDDAAKRIINDKVDYRKKLHEYVHRKDGNDGNGAPLEAGEAMTRYSNWISKKGSDDDGNEEETDAMMAYRSWLSSD